MPSYTGQSGQNYNTPGAPLASGGEGAVYDIIGRNDIVAKIYHEKKRTSIKREKILTMLKTPPKPDVLKQMTWPLDALFENGIFVGFVMARLSHNNRLNEIYSYDKRSGLPWTLFIAIAQNFCACIDGLHAIGDVCGDLNPNNVLVNPHNGIITMVDTDSYHICDTSTGMIYRCEVAMPIFIPRELQGKNFGSDPLPTFTRETDLFALAVHIFSLLMNGCHPFACTVPETMSSSTSFQPIDNIARGLFPFLNRNAGVGIPMYAPPLEVLPEDIKGLFAEAFINGHTNPTARPKAEEWYYALERLANSTNTCAVQSSHIFYNRLPACPWCQLEDDIKQGTSRIKQKPYIPPPVTAPMVINPPPPNSPVSAGPAVHYCWQCGEPMLPGYIFCQKCGAKKYHT